MTIPVMTFVDGQGGNISINGVILQPTRYRIGRVFVNQNVTTTGAGGWRQRKRVINDWNFEAHFFFDAAHPPANVAVLNGVYIPARHRIGIGRLGKRGRSVYFPDRGVALSIPRHRSRGQQQSRRPG